MSFLEDGIYYYNFIAPNVVGIYPTIALCYFTTGAQEETADSGYINIGTLNSGTYISTQIKDNVYWKIEEFKVGTVYRLDFGENYTNITTPTFLTEVDIIWSGKWNGGTDYLTIYIYNFTSNSWIALPNTISDTGGARMDISNSIATANATISGIRKNSESRLRIVDTTSADGTKSKVETDYLAINFVGLASPEYKETKGSSEINVRPSTSGSKDTRVDTLCGEIEYGEASQCGDFVNYNEATNYTEQEILENITVTSLTSLSETETYWEYWSPMTLDCTSIYWIKYWNGTGWDDVTDQAVMHGHMGDENCHIRMPITVGVGESYEYTILMDNYIKWELEWTKSVRDIIYQLIYPSCMAYAIQNNYTYVVPILDGTFVNMTDFELGGCHKFLDDIYWIDYYYDLSQNVTNVAEYTSYFLELRWYETALRQHNQLYNSVISGQIYQNLLASNLSSGSIWNYPNRTVSPNFDGARFVGGTEYSTGEIGKASVQLLTTSSGNPIPVTTANCNISIYYPNDTLFISGATANYVSGSDGLYSYNFTVPNTYGIYSEQFYCIAGSKTYYASGSFHVSSWADTIFTMNNSMIDFRILLLGVNSSIFNHISNVNSSIQNRLDDVNSRMSDYNSSISNLVSSSASGIISLINSVNSSIHLRLDTLDSHITSVNDTAISIYNLLNSVNSSLQGRFDNVDAKLNQIYSINVQTNDTVTYLKLNLNYTAVIDLINLVNASLYMKTDETETLVRNVNLSIMTKLYSLQSELASVNQSIYDRFGQTDNLIISVNSSIANQIYDLKTDVQNAYDEIVNVFIQLNMTNQSIMNKLYLIQGDLADIYTINQEINATVQNISIDLTPITDFLYLMNQTMITEFSNLSSKGDAINLSIMTKLYSMQNELANIYAVSLQINDTIQDIYSINQSIQNNLDSISNLIGLVNISLYDNQNAGISSISGQISAINLSMMNHLDAVNLSILTKLYAIQGDLANIYDLNIQINGTVSNLNISINTTALENLMNDINQTLNIRFDEMEALSLAINQSIMNKLYLLQSELASVNQSLYDRMGQTDNLIISVNQSIMDKLSSFETNMSDMTTLILTINDSTMNQLFQIQSDVLNTYQEVVNVYSQLNQTNQSIMNKLYSMQTELQNIYDINVQINNSIGNMNVSVNLTPILDFLYLMNYSMTSGFSDMTSVAYSINQSISEELYSIQSDISAVYSVALQINGTASGIADRLELINQSITEAIFGINNSIMTKLYSIQNDLQTINQNLTELSLLIDDVNSSIIGEIYNTQNQINSLSIQIDDVNYSIMTKLFNIQDEISSVNDSVISSTQVIMAKLYGIQADIASVNITLITYLLLLSNATMNITVQQQDIFNNLVALWGDQIAAPPMAAGFTGFSILPSVSAQSTDEYQYRCIDNFTLEAKKSIFLNVSGVTTPYERIVQIPCTRGCVSDHCMPDPSVGIMWTIMFVVFLVGILWIGNRFVEKRGLW
jgi:hypothetical protein